MVGSSVVNVSSILGAEASSTGSELRNGSINFYTYGLSWLEKNPVTQETCLQYFKEALIVWSHTVAVVLLADDIRMHYVEMTPIA
jgi:hypothetical protein